MDTTISTVHTNCKRCAFAQYSKSLMGEGAEEKEVWDQTGCAIDRLKMYEEARPESTQKVTDEEMDVAFYIINDSICPYRREISEEIFSSPEDVKELKDKIDSSVRLRYHAVIDATGHKPLEDIKKTVESIMSQKKKPIVLSVITNSDLNEEEKPRIKQIHSYLSSLNVQWWMLEIIAENTDFRHTVDVVVSRKKNARCLMYCLFNAGSLVPEDYYDCLVDCVLDPRKHFLILTPNEEGNGLTVFQHAHEKHSGNSFGINIENKVAMYEAREGYNPIRKVGDICENLKLSQ